MEQIYLTRRNLLTLLSKLDRVKAGEVSACTLVKFDNKHAEFPQSMEAISITAVEDDDYYVARDPGTVHPQDDPNRLI